MEQGLQELSDERTDSPVKETSLSSSVVVPPRSPLSDSFFDPFLLILPDLISSNTPISFL